MENAPIFPNADFFWYKKEHGHVNIKPVHHKNVRAIFPVIEELAFVFLFYLVTKHPEITQGELTF